MEYSVYVHLFHYVLSFCTAANFLCCIQWISSGCCYIFCDNNAVYAAVVLLRCLFPMSLCVHVCSSSLCYICWLNLPWFSNWCLKLPWLLCLFVYMILFPDITLFFSKVTYWICNHKSDLMRPWQLSSVTHQATSFLFASLKVLITDKIKLVTGES